jgi:protein SCO1/2
MRLNGAAASLFAFVALAACTNGGGLGSIGGGNGGGSPSPLPSGGIGIGIPTGKIGVENDPTWGTVSGYTQAQTSQVMAFAPGVKVTLQNLSKTTPHTLNVVGTTTGPPANFPQSPSLSFSPSGNGVLGATYASGSLNIEFSMRDVIQVVAGATPGPTASPGPGGYAALPAHPRATVRAQRQPHLVDQQGRSFDLASLRGMPLAVTFVSAHCNDACPLINAQFGAAARRIQEEKIAARLLTITLDPEHDSPRTMRELANRFEANPRYWLVAAGSTPDVHAIMRAFGAISIEGKRGYHDRHTTFVYLLNARGRLAQTMLASSALSDAVVDALRDRSMVAQR